MESLSGHGRSIPLSLTTVLLIGIGFLLQKNISISFLAFLKETCSLGRGNGRGVPRCLHFKGKINIWRIFKFKQPSRIFS